MAPDEHEQILEPQRSYESFSERLFGLSLSKFFLALVLILGGGTYLGLILFGDNSLVLFDYHFLHKVNLQMQQLLYQKEQLTETLNIYYHHQVQHKQQSHNR